MNIIDFAEALVLFLEAKEKVSSKEISELLQLASKKMENAILQSPSENPEYFFQWGNVLFEQGMISDDHEDADRLFRLCFEKYQLAINLNMVGSRISEAYFQQGRSLNERAKRVLKRAWEAKVLTSSEIASSSSHIHHHSGSGGASTSEGGGEGVGGFGILSLRLTKKVAPPSKPTQPNNALSSSAQMSKEWRELFIAATQRFKAALLNNQDEFLLIAELLKQSAGINTSRVVVEAEGYLESFCAVSQALLSSSVGPNVKAQVSFYHAKAIVEYICAVKRVGKSVSWPTLPDEELCSKAANYFATAIDRENGLSLFEKYLTEIMDVHSGTQGSELALILAISLRRESQTLKQNIAKLFHSIQHWCVDERWEDFNAGKALTEYLPYFCDLKKISLRNVLTYGNDFLTKVADFCSSTLTIFHVANCDIQPEAFSTLFEMCPLAEVSLKACSVSATLFRKVLLEKRGAYLISLSLSDLKQMNGKWMKGIAKKCSALQYLYIRHCFDGDSVKKMATFKWICRDLRQLHMVSCNVTLEALIPLFEVCAPKLEFADLRDNNGLLVKTVRSYLPNSKICI
jgi:hypothetical protein